MQETKHRVDIRTRNDETYREVFFDKKKALDRFKELEDDKNITSLEVVKVVTRIELIRRRKDVERTQKAN